MARRLIEMSADVNAKEGEGRTPLHYALCAELDMIILLLKAGAQHHT